MSFLESLRRRIAAPEIRQAETIAYDAVAEAMAWRDAALSLRESQAAERQHKETIAALELQIEDLGWRRMAADGQREISRGGLNAIAALARIMYLQNPLINRGVDLQAFYVFAQGFTITSADETTQAALNALWEDRLIACEVGQQAMLGNEASLQVDGNLFFLLVTNSVTGKRYIRSIPANEITEIVMNPDDSAEPWLYRRMYQRQEFDVNAGITTTAAQEAFYPAYRYSGDIPPTIAGRQVMSEQVYHVKVGCLRDMRFGVSEAYQAINWAIAYKDFLADWATLSKAYARFAFKLAPGGGKAGIATAKARLGTTIGTGGSGETNPPPTAGSTFIGNDAVKLEAVKTANATTNPEQARHLKLMVCAAFGMPETFFGDVNTGNLATASSLDRPTELKFKNRQMLWQDVLRDLFQFLLEGAGIANAQIEVKFPPILEHSVTETVTSIVDAATLAGRSLAGTIDLETTSRLLLAALGVDDPEPIITAVLADAADAALRDPVTQQPPKIAEAAKALRGEIEAFGAKYKAVLEAMREAA